MVFRKRAVLVVALVLVLVLGGGGGSGGCGFVGSDAQTLCNMTEDDLKECKPAVTAPNPAVPSDACCAGMAKADLPCLCSYRHSMLLPALGVDPELAMQLPSKCKLTPPAQC